MCVNKIEPLRTLKFADLTQDSRKKESPSRRKSKASGQGQVSKPFGTHTGLPGLNLSPKTWPNRENGVYQPSLGERGERFLDGTASRVVLPTRIKLCEGKKAKGPASLYGCVSLRLTEDGWKLRISDHNLSGIAAVVDLIAESKTVDHAHLGSLFDVREPDAC